MQKIRVAGIVAEYNPFHKGHEWMLTQLREAGCEAVVCVMSGAYVQRAEAALFPPHIRARAAVAGGADLVLRLPLPWAAASAERFAAGAVGLLAALGCADTLAFGAETADTDALESAAMLLESPEFREALKGQLATGVSFATARARAMQEVEPGAAQLLGTPNNILAIEYIKALQGPVLQSAAGSLVYPQPYAIPRKGTAHDAQQAAGEFASASLLRKQLHKGGTAALKDYVPAACLPLYEQAVQSGEVLDTARFALALLARLKGRTAEALAAYPSAGEGLEVRLAEAAKRATGLEGLYMGAKSKRFAHSRVRRLALEAALDLPGTLPEVPPFAQVLAANQRGLGLLKRIKQTASVPVSTSLARLREEGEEAARLVRLEAAAEDLYALCLCHPRPGGGSYTQPAAILRG